jgi:two-component sensor histidine kinase/putative methionine-R-sulfoxide reductase with GAF domain
MFMTAETTQVKTTTSGSRIVALLRTLNAIGRLSSSSVSEQAIAEFVTTSVVDLVGGDGGGVFLFHPETQVLQLRASVGFTIDDPDAISLSVESGIVGQAVMTRETIVAPEAREHPAYVEIPGTGEEIFRSHIATPMIDYDTNTVVGVLSLFTKKRRQFADETVEFLEALAREAAHALVASRNRSANELQLQRKISQLNTLQRVTRMIASSLDLDEVLRSIAAASLEIVDAEAAAVFRLPPAVQVEKDGNSLVLDHWVGDRSNQIVDESSRTELVMQVIRSGAARITELEYIDGSSLLFCMPLRSARGTMGALCVRLSQGVEISDDDLGLLQAFTDSASLAIENAQLYHEAQASVRTSSTLLQEMHHRVRNNLQTVAALLSLQLRETQSPESVTVLREAVSRVQAIAAVHDLLSDEGRLAGATIDAIAQLVVDQAAVTAVQPPLRVTFDIAPSSILVGSRQATVLALVINELIANAIEHGFEDRSEGRISIRCEMRGALCYLDVENDGEPLPDTFNIEEGGGLGMKIVERLVTSDLGGRFVMAGTDTGTRVRLIFPVTPLETAEPGLSPTR